MNNISLEEAIKVVDEHQKWRKGEPPYDGIGVDSPDAPKRITEALDTLIAHAKQPVRVTGSNGYFLPLDCMTESSKRELDKFLKLCPRITNIQCRKDGREYVFEADMLKYMTPVNQQPMQVTDEMVEAAVDAIFAVLGKNRDLYTMLRHDQLVDAAKAALQAALRVEVSHD